MTERKETESNDSAMRIKGLLTEEGVKITDEQAIDELSSKGYGVVEGKRLLLAFCEALYLLDKALLEVKDKKRGKLGFQDLLQRYGSDDENAWAKYLTYRDLRSRGYVVREGFGLGVDFRVYDRGEYSKDTAKYLVLNLQEGKPISVEDMTNAMRQCQNLKKEMIMGVMNRRGEIVYYSVSQLTMK
jgi:tRNA-intron endonuclease